MTRNPAACTAASSTIHNSAVGSQRVATSSSISARSSGVRNPCVASTASRQISSARGTSSAVPRPDDHRKSGGVLSAASMRDRLVERHNAAGARPACAGDGAFFGLALADHQQVRNFLHRVFAHFVVDLLVAQVGLGADPAGFAAALRPRRRIRRHRRRSSPPPPAPGRATPAACRRNARSGCR